MRDPSVAQKWQVHSGALEPSLTARSAAFSSSGYRHLNLPMTVIRNAVPFHRPFRTYAGGVCRVFGLLGLAYAGNADNGG